MSNLENGLEGYKPVRKEITSVILEKDASRLWREKMEKSKQIQEIFKRKNWEDLAIF